MGLTRVKYNNVVDTDYKQSVRVITTTGITLAGGAPNAYDSLTLAVGDRILVNAQSTSSQNGIYIVSILGTGSNGTWIRSPDASASAYVTAGMRTYVAEGTYAGTEFRLVTPDPITLGTTSLTFQSSASTVSGVNRGVQYNNAGFIAGAYYLVYDNATGNVVVASSTPSSTTNTGALVVAGGVGIVGALNVGGVATFNSNVVIVGNLTTLGNTFITNSTDLSIQDSIINLHSPADLSPLLTNDGKDIGIKLHYYSTADKFAFFGRGNDTGYLEWYSDGLEDTGQDVFNGIYGTIKTGNILLVSNLYRGSSTVESGVQTHAIAYTTSSATPPSNPQVGDQWYDTSTDVLYQWFTDGTSSYWIDKLSQPVAVSFASQSTPPIGAKLGDAWYDTSSDTLYNYIYDGSSFYWVDFSTKPSSVGGTGALLANVSVGNISAQDITANSVAVTNTYGGVAVNNSRGQFVLGNDARDGVARYISNTVTGIYSGMSIQRSSNELWFTGANTQENYVIRRNGATDVISIGANNTVSLVANINSLGSGLFQGAYDEASTTSGVFVGNTGSGVPSPRIGFYTGDVSKNWQIDNYNGTFRWFVPNNTRMSLDAGGNLSIASGSVYLPASNSVYVNNKKAVNGPAFRAYVAVNQTIPTGGAQTKVTFGSETYDTDNCFTGSAFTPTVEGYYQFNATVRMQGPSGTNEVMFVLWKNGTEYARGTNSSGTELGANFYALQVSTVAYANGTTDYFEIAMQHGHTVGRDTTAGTNISHFSGAMVRGA